MGQTDGITKKYMGNPVIFADVFNKFIYGGKQIIDSEGLKELDPAEIVVIPGEDGKAGAVIQKYRDLLKLCTIMTDGKGAYCVLGIENQSQVHYAMPVRNGLYDFMQLERQVENVINQHKAAGDKPSGSAEFLSGFKKADKIIPVVTLVVYFGAGKWDGPVRLSDMYAESDPAILKYAVEYEMNIISPESMSEDDFGQFHTELKQIFEYIKYSKNKEELDYILEKDDNFRQLDRAAANLLNDMTNSGLKYPEGEGAVDVCVAVQQMREESEMLGAVKAREMIAKSLLTTDMSFEDISKHSGLPLEKVQELAGSKGA